MNMKELFEMTEKDFDINYSNMKDKLFIVPKLHNKYLRLFFKEKNKLTILENELKKIYRDKYHYYSTEFNYVLNGKEIQYYIEGDEEYQDIYRKYNNQKSLVRVLEECVDSAKKLSFSISNILKYMEYMNGGV